MSRILPWKKKEDELWTGNVEKAGKVGAWGEEE